MDIKQIEILARFYLQDEKVPFVDKTVTSRQEAVELAHEGVWVKDSFYLVRKMTILPPARKPKPVMNLKTGVIEQVEPAIA
jgi:hypothetical protein